MGQGRAPGVGSEHRAADATAGFAPYAAARLTGRALGRAGQQNVGNSPAHPTSLFSSQSERGEPRHVGCSAPSTTSACPHALFCGFSYKNFAETGPISRLRVVLLQNPCGGTKCACFRACARVCRGGSRHARGGCGRVEPIHAVFAHGCCSCGRRSAAARPGAPLKNRPAYALQLCLGHF